MFFYCFYYLLHVVTSYEQELKVAEMHGTGMSACVCISVGLAKMGKVCVSKTLLLKKYRIQSLPSSYWSLLALNTFFQSLLPCFEIFLEALLRTSI